jgi:predicted MFS family arabinose efflux permease
MNAVTLNTMIQQVSFLLGPLLAGALIDTIGLDLTYFFDAVLLVPAMVAVLAMRSSGKPEGERGRVSVRSIVEGVKFIWIERIILSLFLLDFAVTLVGFYRPILPIFASDIFDVGATGLGTLYAAPALGAVIGTVSLLLAGDFKHKGALVMGAAIFFAVSLALLGMSTQFPMAVLAVGALGFTDAISVAIRRTVVQLLAPDAMRGRASSLITVFSQSTNALGALLAGTAAALIGAPNALLLGSALCVAIVFCIGRVFPQLWRYRSE